jgi:methionyl aminopeptidase
VAGATTAELDSVVRASIVTAGGEPAFLGYRGNAVANMHDRPAFPAASCISVNEELVHGVPGQRVICDGDIVTIDVGVRLAGWCADSAITVCVGAVDDGARALVACSQRMLDHAVRSIRPGLRWSEIACELERIAVDGGFTIAVDFVGHGIGRELHEPPQVPCCVDSSYLQRGDFTLRPGMVLAIEPMIVFETARRNDLGEMLNPAVTLANDGWTVTVNSGARSCHVEHTVAVTRDGAEVLTAPRANASDISTSAGASNKSPTSAGAHHFAHRAC